MHPTRPYTLPPPAGSCKARSTLGNPKNTAPSCSLTKPQGAQLHPFKFRQALAGQGHTHINQLLKGAGSLASSGKRSSEGVRGSWASCKAYRSPPCMTDEGCFSQKGGGDRGPELHTAPTVMFSM